MLNATVDHTAEVTFGDKVTYTCDERTTDGEVLTVLKLASLGEEVSVDGEVHLNFLLEHPSRSCSTPLAFLVCWFTRLPQVRPNTIDHLREVDGRWPWQWWPGCLLHQMLSLLLSLFCFWSMEEWRRRHSLRRHKAGTCTAV